MTSVTFIRTKFGMFLIDPKLFYFFQIVNLKRFQFLNGRWVKSHKIVNFPVEDFDPSNYLAPRAPSSDSKQCVTCVCQNDKSADIELVPNGDIPNHTEVHEDEGQRG